MLTSINWLIKTQISVLVIKQQVPKIIGTMSMFSFSCRMEKKELLWCLANKFISGEPSKQWMPFCKAITDGL